MGKVFFLILVCFTLSSCSPVFWENYQRNLQAQQYQQQSQYPQPEQLDYWYRQQMYQQGSQNQQQPLPYPQNEYETDLWFRQQMYQRGAQERSNSCGGVKPLPDFGCRLTNRCINGQWEQICN